MAADDAEFLEFFADQYWPLRRVGYLLTGDWHQADELAQDAMARTWIAWGRVRRRDRAAAYARKVLVNRYRSLARRARVETAHLLASRGQEQARFEPDFSGDGQLLWSELRRLPARQRSARAGPASALRSAARTRSSPTSRRPTRRCWTATARSPGGSSPP